MPLINISKFLGINTRTVDAEGNPFYFRDMINFTLSQVWGRLIKRRGYQETLADLEPEPYTATELIDSNLTRQLVIFESDNKTLSKRVWNGTSYNPRETIDDTPMPSDYEIDIMPFMLTYMNTIYSGAGLNAVNYPFYVQHIKEWTNYGGTTPIVVPAGLRISPMDLNKKIVESFGVALSFHESYPLHSIVMEKGTYFVKVFPVLVDGSYGSEITEFNQQATTLDDIPSPIPNQFLRIRLYASGGSYTPAGFPNLLGFDVFVSFRPEGISGDVTFPYYFLERVKFDELYGDVISRHVGKFQDAPCMGTDTSFVLNSSNNDLTYIPWPYVYIIFDYGGTHYEIHIQEVCVDEPNDIIAFYAVRPSAVPEDVDIEIEIRAKWSGYDITVIYDAYYNKLTTEMYEYLNMPKGSNSIPDYRYDLSAVVGNRLFTFRTDSIHAYYSPPDAFNIFTYSNEIVLKDSPVAVISYLDGVLVFSKKRAEFIRVTSAGEVIKEDNFLQFGAISQRSVLSIDSETVFIFSRSGVWRITPRGLNKISEFIQGEVQSDVVLNSLSEDEINSCLMGYNQIRRELQLFFKRQDDSNITFVYDIASSTMTGAECWLKFKLYNPVLWSLLNNDSHQFLLLDGTNNPLVDFNGANPTESVSAEFELKAFDAQLVNKKVRFEKMLIKTNDVSKLNINITYNGVLQVSGALNPKGELYLRAIADDMKIKITAPADRDELHIDKIQIAYQELNR
jgi:hypothetical protein